MRFDLGRSFRTALKIRNMQLVKHYRRVKALEEGAAESDFWLGQVGESGELRVRRFVSKLLSECRGGRRSCRGNPEVASVVRTGPFQVRGPVLLRKQVESVTKWVETLASGPASILPCTTGRMFLGQVINRVSCFLRVDAASKLANQVEQFFTGREGLTKLHSMVPLHDKKKNDFVSLQLVAVHSWLMTVGQRQYIKQVTTEVLGNVVESPLVQMESSCSSRSGDPMNIERKIPTSIEASFLCAPVLASEGIPLSRGESSKWPALFFAMLGCSVWQCARKCRRLHVDTTTLVTYWIGCLLVFFTTGGLIAAWLPGSLTIRKLQLLWYRLLFCALGYSTVDHVTTCIFDDLGHYLTNRCLSISQLSVTSFLSSCSFDLQRQRSQQHLCLLAVC